MFYVCLSGPNTSWGCLDVQGMVILMDFPYYNALACEIIPLKLGSFFSSLKSTNQPMPLKLGSFSSLKSNNQPPGDSMWPFYPLIGGRDSPLKRSLNHPKKVTLNHQPGALFFHCSKFPPDSDDVPFVTGDGVTWQPLGTTSLSGFSRSCGEYFTYLANG